ncbi:FprA family A-type flavoprotein [Geobacter sulfurreducens]|uniref:Rubredoxin:oxygen/nitric oxide oxidoreductase n=1 Tax=Geobacter sulfurreducens (strain ATCC 51573 / DSM 12127 / PCA) TaxID=243231 RepID=Q747H2_GEOSL|nr:FprA family A-type flavoprotein [Geobacter sulfurreducens]AAR36684.1 rubredoxin:oxygen/nitric oxide oxidoreductase [Geobacter sulfurreducens PCA]ADI86047.1 rubredoxin:oxygen/nitric oxide oxidoreductase [Geobacter sulfurreducens KN400]AJY69522.1 lactamase [Geobacter sulfurreducens]QVW35079.1 FprA family A-type flavoprotein [Geobacter sulfurreducens]UAC03946.1 FprA family A-type flavoprotein [Geobacter sulfurreducens]
MKAVEIKQGVFWVGAVDWAVRDFHGYETPRGTTYNNFLIMDEEITLIDTVKYDFADLTIKNIAGIVDPARIKNIIINHIENDHASSLDRIMALAPQATIYISDKGRKGIERFFDLSNWNVKSVKTGDTLCIGARTLEFLETPMLHWPDSMVTYSRHDRILFTQDAFGQHVASASRFDDEFEKSDSAAELEDAVVDYYANILMPFGQMIKTKIAEIQAKGFDIDIIAPDHGLIWRANPGKVLSMYMDMANGKANESVAIIYDTMWQSTEKMAVPIAEGIRAEGLDCRVVKLRATPMSVAIKEFWKSRGALIGSPTLNNILYPSVAEFLTHLRGLRPKNRIVGAFGSYGWGGGAVRDAYEEFKKMGLQAVEPGFQIPYRPSRADEEGAFEFGRNFARQVIEYHKGF